MAHLPRQWVDPLRRSGRRQRLGSPYPPHPRDRRAESGSAGGLPGSSPASLLDSGPDMRPRVPVKVGADVELIGIVSVPAAA
jgi:hypothetical protein